MEECHHLTLTKLAERALQPKVIQKNMDALCSAVNTRSLTVGGWTIEMDPDRDGDWQHQGWKQRDSYENGANYKYEMYLKICFARRDDKPADKNILHAMCRAVHTKSAQPVLGRWTLTEVDGSEYIVPDENNPMTTADFIGYAEVKFPEDWDTYFEHLYGLDPPIVRCKRSIETALETEFEQRNHKVLVGPPGCGKSDILGSFKKMFGDEAVLEFDATATTAAGAIKELSERDILPRLLFIEEIEKVEEKQTAPLLSIMDLRAEIRKTTARSQIQRDTRILCMATVNDYELFCSKAAGALADRFGEPIWFQRPSRSTLEMILQREIAKIPNGDFAWVDPCLDYCEEIGLERARAIISLCLDGKEMWITGEWQEILRATSRYRDDRIPDELTLDWTGD